MADQAYVFETRQSGGGENWRRRCFAKRTDLSKTLPEARAFGSPVGEGRGESRSPAVIARAYAGLDALQR